MNENNIASKLTKIYEQYGYKKIKLSKFEDYNLYNNYKDFLQTEHILTFMNLNGNLQSLRPDVTLSIVKKVLKDNNKYTNKIYYIEDIYKIDSVSNEYEEIQQLGVEIIGTLSTYSNLEIISMAIDSLKSINDEYILEISSIDFMFALIDELNLDEDKKLEILNFIYSKNKHDLEKTLTCNNINDKHKNYIISLIDLCGSYKEILKKIESIIINDKMQKAYNELKILSAVFENYDNFDKILLDFSIESKLGYYNGIIFKGYIKGSNDAVLSGGRYDKLLAKFNAHTQNDKNKKNAIGFAVYMDKLYTSDIDKNEYDFDILILYKSGDEKILLSKVQSLINESKKVRTDIYSDDYNTEYSYKEKYIFEDNNLIKIN
ncbi:ATP phosphoribosyltransferase regulatory subunit [Brachyspira hampsonii]|uniref:ATP phosphoribosyltransferase regulatory subunit n=1 Tax=Brachyspira hampsonii TaxID=1287055 RepID=A0AAC9XJL3_9SPIR|nr:ATP phosphoribosyltransferase regulatory subunit [Brachyspira hampsonii]ASJ20937.1 ATP phosphoribosyltransferase regulatory subunit [Brachyspira hampsonii]OEJ17329.1 ATP phosphoribosyltransferase regulatory subunit [Brachyspira hampsonii]